MSTLALQRGGRERVGGVPLTVSKCRDESKRSNCPLQLADARLQTAPKLSTRSHDNAMNERVGAICEPARRLRCPRAVWVVSVRLLAAL